MSKRVIAVGIALTLAGLAGPVSLTVHASNSSGHGNGNCVSSMMKDRPSGVPGVVWSAFVRAYCGIGGE